jgi:hypothetical protein
MDPGTAMIVASAIAATAQGAGKMLSNNQAEKAAKLRAKEMKRETAASLFGDALNRSAELEATRLAGRKKMGTRRAQSLQETADLLRGAFNI